MGALSDASRVEAGVLAVLRTLTAQPTPRGRERATGEALAGVVARLWPALACDVEPVGEHGANLVVSADGRHGADDLLVCSHLDTSLTGLGAEDAPVTGRGDDAPRGLLVRDGEVVAAGLGVARGPAAAALVGFADALARGAGPARLVLAGSGTHASRLVDGAPPAPSGLAHHLARHPRPAAAVVAKCGPHGVLWEEPGASYVQVVLRAERGAVLARDRVRPPGGLAVALAAAVGEVEAWRTWLRALPVPAGQTGREAGVGHVQAGLGSKPDLLPGAATVGIYLVAAVEDDAVALVEALRERLAAAPALAEVSVDVRLDVVDPPGATPQGHPVVVAARDAWFAAHGVPPPTIRGWTGSTDGALLRSLGVPTARTGPVSRADPGDDRCDTLSLEQLRTFAGVYGGIVRRWDR